MELVDCVPSTLPHGRAGLIFLLRYVCLADSQGGAWNACACPPPCAQCVQRDGRLHGGRHACGTRKRFLSQGESTPWLRKRIRLSIHFREMSEGMQPPPTFVCIRRICRLRRSLILLAKSIPYKFVRPLVERICHFFHTLKPLAEPVASWPGFAMYAHFYTGFSGNVIDFPTRRDKRASRAQNRRFPGTGSIPHNLFRAISR